MNEKEQKRAAKEFAEYWKDKGDEKRGSCQREYIALQEYRGRLHKTNFPDNINRLIDGRSYTVDNIGMSGSQIRIYDDSVLKIANYRKENEDTVQMMRWLEGRIPVPKVICYESDADHQYLLMSKVTGKMSCDEYYLKHPQELLALLVKALKMLWSVDISDCPRNRNIDMELQAS